MNLKKLRQIYRILIPLKQTEEQRFESLLRSNKLITHFEKKGYFYVIKVANSFAVLLRDQEHSDYEVFKQIFNFKEYNVVLNLIDFNLNVQKEKIIIDAGANVGYTSVFFSQYLSNVKIYGIEPSKSNFDMYQKNVSLLSNSENVTIYNRALSEKANSKYIIEREYGDKKDWAITTKEDEGGEIKGITINEIISENNLEYISLLKIDIEGAERFIFKRGQDVSFLKITQVVAIEIHDEYNIRDEIYTVLQSNGFFLFEVSETTIGLNKNIFSNDRVG
jgi:FkbM family methyltransferase